MECYVIGDNGLLLSFSFKPKRGTANVPRSCNTYSHGRRDLRKLSAIICFPTFITTAIQELNTGPG
jgi:hypothetical protein